VVLRIRPEAYGATFEELAADIARAFAQLTRWTTTAPATNDAPAGSPGSLASSPPPRS
jgi:hypothetical protein